MGKVLHIFLAQANFALLPLFAQQDTSKLKHVGSQPDQPGPWGELFETWWLWAGIVLLIGLIGLLLYLRNRPQDG